MVIFISHKFDPCTKFSFRESLERIINKRIGVDLFQEKLELLSKSDDYAKALQKPQVSFSKPNDMVLDYEFARLYKILEGSITRSLTAHAKDEPTTKPPDQSAIMLAQYNEIIQQQAQHINTYQQQERQFFEERNFYQNKIAELERSLQEVRNEYSSMKSSSEQSK